MFHRQRSRYCPLVVLTLEQKVVPAAAATSSILLPSCPPQTAPPRRSRPPRARQRGRPRPAATRGTAPVPPCTRAATGAARCGTGSPGRAGPVFASTRPGAGLPAIVLPPGVRGVRRPGLAADPELHGGGGEDGAATAKRLSAFRPAAVQVRVLLRVVPPFVDGPIGSEKAAGPFPGRHRWRTASPRARGTSSPSPTRPAPLRRERRRRLPTRDMARTAAATEAPLVSPGPLSRVRRMSCGRPDAPDERRIEAVPQRKRSLLYQ
jgi:hypothetical protein